MRLDDRVFDTLAWVARYLLPALGTLYFALSQIWGLAYGEQVVGTLTALTAFLGMILGLSTNQYNKDDHTDGTLDIDQSSHEDKDIYRLNLTTSFDDLRAKDEVVLKVNPKAYISSHD